MILKTALVLVSLTAVAAAQGYFNPRLEPARFATNKEGNLLFTDALRADMGQVGDLAREYRDAFEHMYTAERERGFVEAVTKVPRKRGIAQAALDAVVSRAKSMMPATPKEEREFRKALQRWEKEVKWELEDNSHAPKKKGAARKAASFYTSIFLAMLYSF